MRQDIYTYNYTSSLLINLIDRDDGKEKKQTMA